jgi:hypothetical protein
MSRVLDRFLLSVDCYSSGTFSPSRPGSLDGIIAHLTWECGGNVHDNNIVIVTSSKPLSLNLSDSAKNVVDLEANSRFHSALRASRHDIPHTRNNWICYDFNTRRVIPTHYTIRSSFGSGVNGNQLKSWLIETSIDGENWTEIDRRENNSELNCRNGTRTFGVSRSKESRFIRLINVGRNHYGNDALVISSFEIFGLLME